MGLNSNPIKLAGSLIPEVNTIGKEFTLLPGMVVVIVIPEVSDYSREWHPSL